MVRLLRILPLLLLVLLAFLMRSLSIARVLTPFGVLPVDPDGWYHLRRIGYGVRNFPELLDFDAYLNFPEGARALWTPAFDWTLAAVARLLVGAESQQSVELLAAWVPPALGAVTVLVVYELGARFFTRSVGLAAATVFALLPASILFSRIGFIDHHVAVALASLLLLRAVMAFVSDGPRVAATAALGAGLAGVLILWTGSLVHVAIAESFLVAHILLIPDRPRARRFALALSAAHALAAALVAPFALGGEWQVYSRFDPAVLGDFQPLFFAAACVCWGGAAALWSLERPGRTRSARAGTAAGLGIAVVAALLSIPDLAAAVEEALRWFTQPREFQQYVNELQPLLRVDGRFDPSGAEMLYSRLVYVFPLALVAMAASARRRPQAASVAALVCWCAAMAGFALLQRRFNNSFAPAYALVLGWGVIEGLRRLRPLLEDRPIAWVAAGVFAVGVGIPVFEGPWTLYRSHAAGLAPHLRGIPVTPAGFAGRQARLVVLGRWLRDHTPPTRGFLTPTERPEYGVLARWGDGHLLRYVAERPMVQDNFLGHVDGRDGHTRFQRAEDYFAADSEREALAIAEELGVRYVVVALGGSGHSPGYGPASQFSALHRRVGSARGSHPALRRHRLVHELHPGGGYRVFERVAGAQVVGRASPGVPIEAHLRLTTPVASYTYVQRTVADAQGLYELRLPYSNEAADDGLEPGDTWEIVSGPVEGSLRVPESTVLEGGRIPGPDLSSP
ncbi:MAG: STT3 domain-containing protein [Myxococcota bacterium]